ncbi:hypothetical protein SUGI_0421220 [Cryptomeria japonica]|uniref:cytochrome P450 750A1-like n=1 Tax=Cryptomeria japonica TaxID=3369 RepID=UPI002408C73A|nr:cytochrome P450 750A1-like [Cryptomeria japonica]GLJ22377.1 hypothetical protein SUGI_0421220 [Cryptomeria japonica]
MEGTKDIIDVLSEIGKLDGREITEENIKAIVFDIFVAGVETTSTTLEWAMSAILQNPGVAKKMQEEIDSVDYNFDMVPFGAGRRGCPGEAMAVVSMNLLLAQLIHCFDWSVEGDLDLTEVFGSTTPRSVELLARPALRLSTCP